MTSTAGARRPAGGGERSGGRVGVSTKRDEPPSRVGGRASLARRHVHHGEVGQQKGGSKLPPFSVCRGTIASSQRSSYEPSTSGPCSCERCPCERCSSCERCSCAPL